MKGVLSMGRKKQEEAEEGANWMDTYGDVVTLLLTFFVLLFAMSSVDSEKWQMLVTALKGEFKTTEQITISNGENEDEQGNDQKPPSGESSTIGLEEEKVVTEVQTFNDLYIYLKQYVEKEGLEGDIQLTKGDGFTFIQFNNNIFFDGDSSVLRQDGKNILNFFAGAVENIPDEIKEVAVYGHTAQELKDTPNRVEIDWALSGDRAKNVVLYMIGKNVLTNEKYSSSGFGQNRPIVPHDGTELSRQKNRRVEMRITQAGSSKTDIEEIYKQINGDKTSNTSSSSS